jgi:group II intron reverse transcriptase/maturase
MTDAPTSLDMSPGLLKVAERARQYPGERILALAHHVNGEELVNAFGRLRADAAVGVDGVTVAVYGARLAENVRALHERMKTDKYRHQPIRRVHIPKENGTTRPIGISTVEDKVVQGALREVLQAVHEQDFLDCSYGFRPGRGAHDAIRALNRAAGMGIANYVLEADIVSFFDSLDRKMLMEMLRGRIADERLMRLVGKCLHVGILDGEDYFEPETGTTQGSVLSPLLGNVYLHHVLDVWFKREVQPRLRGRSTLVRYADDFVICFEDGGDAERVYRVLGERMKKYGLALHPEKTQLLRFQPPTDGGGKGSATFDFLGFTLHWQRTLRGKWRLGCRTRRARLQRAIQRAADWCRRYRHLPVKDQRDMLSRKLVGHYNYFGVNGNLAALRKLAFQVTRTWRKWLDRRSQNARMNWKRFQELLLVHPLPVPRIVVQIWGN